MVLLRNCALLAISFIGDFMVKFISSSIIASALLATYLAVPAEAQTATRAWVSGKGTDASGCGAPTDPCRSLQYVHDNIIAAGGEIDILDPAGYGAVTIRKALSIVNDGVGTAGVQASSGTAIAIAAGASDNVTLRGLNVDGLNSASVGLYLTSAGSLTITNCVFRHFAIDGLITYVGSGATDINISNTIVSDNQYFGIIISTNSTGTTKALISQTTVANNTNGFTVQSQNGSAVSLTVVDSIAFNNSSAGFQSESSGANMVLGHSVATGNGTGVFITGGGTAQSFGDNKISGNTTQVSGTFSSTLATQ
jgi:hypothetical protein